MIRGAIGNLDVAQVVLYAFWLFFAGLIWYLRGEDRREGYPLEESNGRLRDHDFVLIPAPKTFSLANGKKVQAPNYVADTRPDQRHQSGRLGRLAVSAERRSHARCGRSRFLCRSYR